MPEHKNPVPPSLSQDLKKFFPYVTSDGATKLGGKHPVIKFGGSLLAESNIRQNIIHQLVVLQQLGVRVTLVHGGGAAIGDALKQRGIETHFVRGLRVTPKDALSVMTETLDKLNAELVALTNAAGGHAVGCRAILSPLRAVPLDPAIWGHVGKVTRVRTDKLKEFPANRILFLSCLAKEIRDDGDDIQDDIKGDIKQEESLCNVNADAAAAAVAVAVASGSLIYLTDQTGILDRSGNLLSELSAGRIRELRESGVITTGMLPKSDAMLAALNGGVHHVRVVGGRLQNCILNSLCTDATIGTRLIAD